MAHLAAGAAEEAALVEARVARQPDRPTEAFETREMPYRELPDDVLRDRLFDHLLRLAAALEKLGNSTVLFTGRTMTASDFAMHSRSECALHRWDLVGRDDIGWAMLANPDLTRHAVATLTSMAILREAPMNRFADLVTEQDTHVLLRSEPYDDVVMTLSNWSCDISFSSPTDGPADLELEPSQRLLLLWGRREPSSAIQLRAADGPSRRLLDALLG